MITVSINLYPKGKGGVRLPLGLRSPAAQAVIARRFGRAGLDLVGKLKEEAPIDSGNIRRAHGSAVDVAGSRLFVFNRSQYALWAHEGRKPGKRPPIEALIPWCRRHIVNARIGNQLAGLVGIGKIRKSATKDELAQARQFAFLLARAIGRRGVKPNRWFDRVLQSYGMPRIVRAGNEISGDLANLAIASVEQAAIDAQKKFTGL